MARPKRTTHQGLVAFGRDVRRARVGIGWHLIELAKAAKISKGYLSLIETGRAGTPSYDVLDRIGKAMSISPAAYLFPESYHAPALPPEVLPLPKLAVKPSRRERRALSKTRQEVHDFEQVLVDTFRLKIRRLLKVQRNEVSRQETKAE